MHGTVLIHAQNVHYGLYLQSLVSQVGYGATVRTGPNWSPRIFSNGKPLLAVFEVKEALPRGVREGWPADIPLVVVSEGPLSGDFIHLQKPIKPSHFTEVLTAQLPKAVDEDPPLTCEPFLIGNSAAIAQIRKVVARVSPTDLAVLLGGETGTGKGLIAQALHNNSPRRSGPFLEINCSSIPASLLESELFGYRKGAFTGAWRDKPGKFDLADSGTIFLDEISEMDRSLQAKLLQVLQEGEYCPVGSVTSTRVNVRIISASNADLEEMTRTGRFRSDLYFRLKVIHLHLPPLRERREDIGVLKEYFLEKYHLLYEAKPVALSRDFCALLEEYDWPGNVRELENTVKSVVALGSEALALEELRRKVKRRAHPKKWKDAAAEHVKTLRSASLKDIAMRVAEKAERAAIAEALLRCNGNKKAAAKLLDVSYKSLLTKIRAYEL